MSAYAPVAESERAVDVRVANFTLEGTLSIPRGAAGLVLLVHDNGSSRLGPHFRLAAAAWREAGLATLRLYLLTPAEAAMDQRTAEFRSDIALLASRVADAADWLGAFPETRRLRLGFYGVSTSGAAALVAAADRASAVSAVVACGAPLNLAGAALARVHAPTLLLTGARDSKGLGQNSAALTQLRGARRLDVIPDASDQFAESGQWEFVIRQGREWFDMYLTA